MRSLVVEGWRGISQSYAMVNQYQLLELMTHDVALFHVDRPYYHSTWSTEKTPDGFDPVRRARLAALPPPPPDLKPDVIFRADFPLRFAGYASKRLFVFGTSEQRNLENKVATGQLPGALSNPDVTVVTPSNWSKEGFVAAGFDPARVLIVPHGVDPAIFGPPDPGLRMQMRRAMGLGEHEFVLLSVGAMTDNKGIDLLILAYAFLRQRYPHLRLVLKDASGLYGKSGKDVLDLLAQHRPDLITEALRASIILLSINLNLSQLCLLYGSCDAYVSPYRAEGFNVPPLEAAACGLPIVVTQGGPTDDYVHESFALTVASHQFTTDIVSTLEPDIGDLMDKIAMLVEGRAPHIDKAFAIRHVTTAFSWAAAVRKLMAAMFP